jgi:hypothetical protein
MGKQLLGFRWLGLKAIVKAEPKPGIEVRDVPAPRALDGYTLLQVKACGI